MDLSGLLNGAEHYEYGEEQQGGGVDGDGDSQVMAGVQAVTAQSEGESVPGQAAPSTAADTGSIAAAATSPQQQSLHSLSSTPLHSIPTATSNLSSTSTPSTSHPPHLAASSNTTSSTTTAAHPRPSSSSSSHPIAPPILQPQASSSSSSSTLPQSANSSSTGKKPPPKKKKKVASNTPQASSSSSATAASSSCSTAAAALDTLALLASQAPTTAAAALQVHNQQQLTPLPSSQSQASSALPLPPPPAIQTPTKESEIGYVDPDWIENTEAVIAEANAELPNHPHIINPYIAKLQVSKAHERNSNLHQYSSSATASLINSANQITQCSAAQLCLIMDSEILGDEKTLALTPGESIVVQSTSTNSLDHHNTASTSGGTVDAIGNGGTSTSQMDGADQSATVPGAPLSEKEEAERLEKLERKKASAREGWKKRRQNALEEKEKLATLEAEALGLNEEETASHIANAIASLNATSKGGAAAQGRGDASSPAPSNASGTGTNTTSAAGTGPKRRRRAPKTQTAQAALESTPLPGSLTHENGVTPHAGSVAGAENDATPLDGQSQNGDIAASTGTSRKRAASTDSNSTAAAAAAGLSANDAKRPRLGDDALSMSDSRLSPSVKVEYSDAIMESGSPYPNGMTSSLPPHLRSSPAPDSDRQVSPALSNTDSARGGGKQGSLQPRERLTGNALQEAERKIWATIARSNIPKVIKYQQQGLTSRLLFNRRLAGAAAREAKKYNLKHPKAPKDVQIKARRVMRELLLHLKGNEKLARENKRKQEKELLDKARKEEEQREAQRQARKLNFLITQTELYSHFVGSKLQTDEMEDSAETAGSTTAKKTSLPTPALGATLTEDGSGPSKADLADIDFDDEKNLLDHARANAQAALEATRNKTKMFDTSYQAEQQASKENYIVADNEEEDEAMGAGDADSGKPDPSLAKVNLDDLNFQNPQMAGDVNLVKQPTMLTCQLKEYQLKGLNWLANLYEQGINGILADEMGLGKTVQSISLMAYLAEYHNIWGPFLVVAPASTLHNWQQEITRFAPALKVLPYWGNVKDRTILRKFWNRKSLRYDQNAPFHVLITSYQLIVTDEQYFGKVKWQYMVLDEAQAIKSSASARWKILLGLNCRNRLLLTGTPIQNSMQELWALLHFIMPSLFDSHNEFSDWFSKDIEGNADKSGGMNEHQLRRLHMILKPFMLRRIKKNVQNELADKIEIDLYCDLTPRQRQMYRTLRQNISIADLVKRASSLSDDDSVKRLMNLIMQFRKVCNHPELFERADVEAPFAFCQFPQNYNLSREGNNLNVQYSTHSLLEIRVPRLLYDDSPKLDFSDTSYLSSLMNIYTSRNLASFVDDKDPAFDFEAFTSLSPQALRTLARSNNPVERLAVAEEDKENTDVAVMQDKISGLPSRRLAVRGRRTIPDDPSWHYLGLPPLGRIQEQYRDYSRFNRSDMRFYIDPAQAPPAELFSSSRSFAYKQSDMRFDENVRTALYGVPGESTGIVGALNKSQLPLAPMEVPQLHKLILDSGKLAKLDELLAQLKAGGHRVLVYFQMTRMIDLMEEYLAFRQYKYLRLDGSSTISERRDMVTDWQTKPELFIFLLSTRAGGLGINLTAADTVVFYDSDWNPSNDVQAMDRAHRLGQTRQVTVYRLITKGTIDERIVQLARTKKSVQDAVVGSSTQAVGAGATDQINSNEVVNLLLDDDELEETMRQKEANRLQQELKSIDNGKKGAKAREENKRAKEIAASAKASGFNSSNGWGGADDDDDAFGFFSNAPNKKYKDPDEDTEGMGGGEDEGGAEAARTIGANGVNGKAKPAKGKGSRAKKTNPDDPDAPPAKKRKPAVKKEGTEDEIGPDGQSLKKKRGGGGWPKGKPRGKKLGTETTTGSFNPGAPAISAAPSTAADSSAAPTPASSNA